MCSAAVVDGKLRPVMVGGTRPAWLHAERHGSGDPLIAIGVWYEEFQQVPDLEVTRLLELARTRHEAEQALASAGHGEGATAPG